jgi:hypothetical protein
MTTTTTTDPEPTESEPAPAGTLAAATERLAKLIAAGDEAPEIDLEFPTIDSRERALPVRQGDLTRLLLAEAGLSDEERDGLARLGSLLGANFHSEFYGRLLELKELYAPLDPDSDYVTLRDHTLPLADNSDERFLVPFEATLLRANYRRLDLKVIEDAVSAPNELGLTYTPDFKLFEHLVVYVRGYTKVMRECRSVKTRFKRRRVALDAYQRLILCLKFKPGFKLGSIVRTDVVYLRMFKDVPHVDMEMHLPEQGTRVRMRWIDKAQIASPLVLTLATKIITTAMAFAISPAALLTLAIAPVTAGLNSFFGFHRAKKKHLYEMIHRLYYLSLANNASVLTRIIDSAEDEEYKEAMLAYFILWRGKTDAEPWSVERLDSEIETYLKEKTGVEIDFEVSDALIKLFRLGLAYVDSRQHLVAAPLDQAIQALARHWSETNQAL